MIVLIMSQKLRRDVFNNIATHTCSSMFLNKFRCVVWAEICRSEGRKRREQCVTCSWPQLSTNLSSQHIGLYSDKMVLPTKDTHLWLWWLCNT